MDIFNPFSLEGKTILVSGASSGIGKAVALLCARMGASVYAVARNPERLHEVVDNIQGNNNHAIICDLTSHNDVINMVDKLPKLDGIVHCAGIGQRIPCKDVTSNDIDEIIGTNLKAPVLLQAELLSKKKVNKGASIVFIASIASWSPSLGNSIYSASKGAIISYANCLSLELAPRGVRVNCISPAMVWTNFVLQDEITKEDLLEDEKKYPLKRYGKPEDIANLAIYMLSDASSWMTGSNVNITGGGKLS